MLILHTRIDRQLASLAVGALDGAPLFTIAKQITAKAGRGHVKP
jgi:hypothetical protein